MNDFSHMLKIISLGPATPNMYLERKADTACELGGGSISLQLPLLFFSNNFSFSESQDGKLSWKL